MVGQLRHQVVHPGGEHGVLAVHRARFDQGFHVLAQLPQPVFPPLRHPAGLGEAHHRVGRQVVGGGGQLWVAGGELAVVQPRPAAGFVPEGEQFTHGQEYRLVQTAGAPLGGHVEQPHGVHVPVPELHPHRVVLAGGEHV